MDKTCEAKGKSSLRGYRDFKTKRIVYFCPSCEWKKSFLATDIDAMTTGELKEFFTHVANIHDEMMREKEK